MDPYVSHSIRIKVSGLFADMAVDSFKSLFKRYTLRSYCDMICLDTLRVCSSVSASDNVTVPWKTYVPIIN